MIISCSSCETKYKYDETKLEGVISKKVRCPKCKTIIEVMNPFFQPKKDIQIDPLEQTHSSDQRKKASVPKPALVTQPMSEEEMQGPPTASVNRQSVMSEGLSAEHDEYLKMPESRRFSLAVIQGFNAGEIFSITKPKMVIGRSDADINVKDLEASRQHARLDVMGDRVILRDLGSTNGTFVNEQRITTMALDNQQEFRIGTTIFMLIITDVE